MSIDLRVKVAVTGGGTPSSVIRIGSTSGGQEIILDQTILPAATVGSIVGGFSLNTLGADLSQITGFEAVYPASQEVWANVTESGSPATGTITAYLLWQGFP
jgi:cation transporter-like permease